MAMFSAALNGLLNRASVVLPGPMALHAELEHYIVVMYACICYICLLRYGRIRLLTLSQPPAALVWVSTYVIS